MIVVAEQPHYLPWLDFYEEAARANVLVVLDDVQWIRRGWQRRTRIALPPGAPLPAPPEPPWQWLSIPLDAARRDDELRALAVDQGRPWTEKHLSAITHTYARRPYFKAQVLPRLEALYAEARTLGGPGSLLQVLLRSFRLFAEPLGVRPELRLASTLDRSDPDRTGRLVQLCTQLGADTYYSGLGSVLYLKPGPFRAAGVRLLWQRFRHPPYDQGVPGRPFVPSLSIVDVLSSVPEDEVRRWLEPSPHGPFGAVC